MQTAARVTPPRHRNTPPVCGACSQPCVHPEFGFAEGSRWRVLLRCLGCGWRGQALLDETMLERFERELDRQHARLEAELELLTERNMREYHDRFAAALAADAILPEDF